MSKQLWVKCATLSQLVYDDLKSASDHKFFTCASTDTQVGIWYSYDEVFVVFRGTSSGMDVMTDLRRMRSTRGEHSGFEEAYNSIAPRLHSELSWHRNKRIVVTGHSLGGALAQICYADLIESWPVENIQCVTFGSPRVFGVRRALRLPAVNVTLVEHYLDPVTMVPFLGYRKASQPSNFWRWGRQHGIDGYVETVNNL